MRKTPEDRVVKAPGVKEVAGPGRARGATIGVGAARGIEEGGGEDVSQAVGIAKRATVKKATVNNKMMADTSMSN